MPLNRSGLPGLRLGLGLGEKGKGDLPPTAVRGWRATEVRRLPAARRGEGGKRAANQDDRAQLPQLRMQI